MGSDTRIRWEEEEYFLLGTIETGGAICTLRQFDTFKLGPAHLFEDGKIMSYGKQVGTKEDIEVLEKDVDIFDYI